MIKHISNAKPFFENKNWVWKESEQFISFQKVDSVKNQKFKSMNFEISNLINQFKDKTYAFFKKNLKDLNHHSSLNIFKAYEDNSFVGAGLEIYHDYFYTDKNLPKYPSIIFQPCIRMGNSLNSETKSNSYLYSSLVFLNTSVVDYLCMDYVKYIDLMISYISSFGVFANRIIFSIDKNIINRNNQLFSLTTRFYVDGIEVGDVIVYEKSNGENFVEFGIGFERLVLQVLQCNYSEMFNEENHELTMLQNFLVFISMNNLKEANRGAKSKISLVSKTLKKYENFDSYRKCKKHFDYWKSITDNNISFVETMTNFERIIDGNFL